MQRRLRMKRKRVASSSDSEYEVDNSSQNTDSDDYIPTKKCNPPQRRSPRKKLQAVSPTDSPKKLINSIPCDNRSNSKVRCIFCKLEGIYKDVKKHVMECKELIQSFKNEKFAPISDNQCSKCPYAGRFQRNLLLHIKKMHAIEKIECTVSVAEQKSSPKQNLTKISLSFDEPSSSTIIKTKNDVKSILRQSSYRCNQCVYVTTNRCNFQRHIKLKHAKETIPWLNIVDKQGNLVPESEATSTKITHEQVTSFLGSLHHNDSLHSSLQSSMSRHFDDDSGNDEETDITHVASTSWILNCHSLEPTESSNDIPNNSEDSQKTYPTAFHTGESNEAYDAYFQYTFLSKDAKKYQYKCPSCSVSINTLTLPMLQIAVMAHIYYRHQTNRCLMLLVEEEIKTFNQVFNTTFKFEASLGAGPLLASDFILKDDSFFVTQSSAILRDTKNWRLKFFVCRQCFLTFTQSTDFLLHLKRVHSIFKRLKMVLVKPAQILNGLSQRKETRNMEEFPIAINEKGDFIWECFNCDVIVSNSSASKFFVQLAVHLLPKISSIEFKTRNNAWLSTLFNGKELKKGITFFDRLYAQLITNCRDLAAKPAPKLPESDSAPTKTYSCHFCGFKIPSTSDVPEQIAVVCHIVRDHNDFSQNSQILNYIALSDAGSVFPFLDHLYEGNLTPLKQDRRVRCSICQCVFESFNSLKQHAALHIDNSFKLDPLQYFFVMTPKRCKLLIYDIDGIGPTCSNKFKIPPTEVKVYACVHCSTTFEQSPCLKFQAYEHIRQCNYPPKNVVKDLHQNAVKDDFKMELNNRRLRFECNTCQKVYEIQQASTCCTSGIMLPVETTNQEISPNPSKVDLKTILKKFAVD